MIRLFGYTFLSLILAVVIWICSSNVGNQFLDSFLGIPLLEVMVTLVGLNIAGAIFLLGHLIAITPSQNPSIFKKAKIEIRENLYLMLALLLLSFLLLALNPRDVATVFMQITINFHKIVDVGLITIFLLTLFSVYEIVQGVFRATSFQDK